jgi:hypothetical protein
MAHEDKRMDFAWECVRLADLSDNHDVRNHLEALALHTAAEMAPEKDDRSNVIEFPRQRSDG